MGMVILKDKVHARLKGVQAKLNKKHGLPRKEPEYSLIVDLAIDAYIREGMPLGKRREGN